MIVWFGAGGLAGVLARPLSTGSRRYALAAGPVGARKWRSRPVRQFSLAWAPTASSAGCGEWLGVPCVDSTGLGPSDYSIGACASLADKARDCRWDWGGCSIERARVQGLLAHVASASSMPVLRMAELVCESVGAPGTRVQVDMGGSPRPEVEYDFARTEVKYE